MKISKELGCAFGVFKRSQGESFNEIHFVRFGRRMGEVLNFK
jgi:hypothetical protein